MGNPKNTVEKRKLSRKWYWVKRRKENAARRLEARNVAAKNNDQRATEEKAKEGGIDAANYSSSTQIIPTHSTAVVNQAETNRLSNINMVEEDVSVNPGTEESRIVENLREGQAVSDESEMFSSQMLHAVGEGEHLHSTTFHGSAAHVDIDSLRRNTEFINLELHAHYETETNFGIMRSNVVEVPKAVSELSEMDFSQQTHDLINELFSSSAVELSEGYEADQRFSILHSELPERKAISKLSEMDFSQQTHDVVINELSSSSSVELSGGYKADQSFSILHSELPERKAISTLSEMDFSGQIYNSQRHFCERSAVKLGGNNEVDTTFNVSNSVNPPKTCETPRPSHAEIVTASSEQTTYGESSNLDENEIVEDEISLVEDRVQAVTIHGRRIIDLSSFWVELHKQLDNHKCSFENIQIDKHVDRGLRTQLFLSCRTCNFTGNIWTDPQDGPYMGINQSAVCGTLTSGIGCATLQEVLASMGIPYISQPTYKKYRHRLYDPVIEACRKEMKRAAGLEMELAIQSGHITNDGIPYISVVADGAWAKRSYGAGKHDSLSGCAIIFGQKTGLAIFIGVRNKYCAVCDKAERQGTYPSTHDCFKNWGREQSSTSMEKHIIVEGFNTSLETHGLIYKTLISDGDSNVYKGIRDANPYAKHGVIVQKIECNNHLFRNLCKKYRTAAEKSIPRLISATLSIRVTLFRKRIANAGLEIRQHIELARDIRKSEDIPDPEKNKKLQTDILVIFRHVFGDHSACESLPFTCDSTDTSKNLIPDLQRTGIYPEVYKAVTDLSGHVYSLLENVTNNVAEGCNSLVNKCNAGKRTNQCARNAYEIRCYAAVMQHNTQKVLSEIHRGVGKTVPSSVLEMERSRKVHVSKNKALRQETNLPKRRSFFGTDKDYGPSAEKPDLPKDAYDVLVQDHFRKLDVNQANRDEIEKNTVSQSDCDYWHILRNDMITASKFGQLCRMLPSTSCGNMVMSLRYPKVVDTEATRYGIANEPVARETLEQILGKKIAPCGLFIDSKIPYLGASPDGLIDTDGIVEIKCVYTARDMLLTDVLASKDPKVFPRVKSIFDKNNTDRMSKTHFYYYQVQGQLHITQRAYCIFAVWTPLDMKCIKVLRDDEFWRLKMEPFLIRFYMECLLPEIVDSRYSRSMPIRDPEYILRAKELKQNKKLTEKRKCKSNLELQTSPVKRAKNVTDELIGNEDSVVIDEPTDNNESVVIDEAIDNNESVVIDESIDINESVVVDKPIDINESLVIDKAIDNNELVVVDKPIENNQSVAIYEPIVINKPTQLSNSFRARIDAKKSPHENWAAIEYEPDFEILEEEIQLLETLRENVEIDEVITDIRQRDSLLNDSSIDFFQSIVAENTALHFYPASYSGYYRFIKPYQSGRDLQIIGGNISRHWVCVYHDGTDVFVYDSMLKMEFERLHYEIQRHIRRRYPHIPERDIILVPVTQQPDSFSCGVYAAAFATSVALGDDPSAQTYSQDPSKMREHLIQIIRNRKLLRFPVE